MGAAKRNGTFEERKAKAIERNRLELEAKYAKIDKELADPRRKGRATRPSLRTLALIAGSMSLGVGEWRK